MNAVYYFTGTGNSLVTARAVAEKLPDCKTVRVTSAALAAAETPAVLEKAVFVFPAYAYGLPVLMRLFLKRAVIKCDYAAALVTYGSSPGGTLREAGRILKRKGIKLNYAAKIPAVENFIPIFGAPSDKKLTARLSAQTEASETAARDIAEGAFKKARGGGITAAVRAAFRIFRPGLRRFYRVSDDCTGCGLCARVCPAAAVTYRGNGKPVFKKTCQVCQSCMNACPRRAISFGRLRPNSGRYVHPEIGIDDLKV